MLLTGLSTGVSILCLLTVSFCVLTAIFVHRLSNFVRSGMEYVLNQNKNAVSLRRIAELEATQTELLDSYTALLDSHKKLRSRIGMRKIREKHSNGVDSGAPPLDEAGRIAYKAKLRAQLKAEGKLP